MNTLRYPRRPARGQHEGAGCGCFGSERLPASIAQLLTPASRMGDACPPRSTCGRATNCREKAFTFCGHWWPGSARTWPDRCACGVISARALRRVNMERFRDVLVGVNVDPAPRYPRGSSWRSLLPSSRGLQDLVRPCAPVQCALEQQISKQIVERKTL